MYRAYLIAMIAFFGACTVGDDSEQPRTLDCRQTGDGELLCDDGDAIAYSEDGACGWDDWVFHSIEWGEFIYIPVDESMQAVHDNQGEWWTVSYITCHQWVSVPGDETIYCAGQFITEYWHCPLY